jgi:hypothetical protein
MIMYGDLKEAGEISGSSFNRFVWILNVEPVKAALRCQGSDHVGVAMKRDDLSIVLGTPALPFLADSLLSASLEYPQSSILWLRGFQIPTICVVVIAELDLV